jgi:aspartate/methionine/tyrosine aminotransferase
MPRRPACCRSPAQGCRSGTGAGVPFAVETVEPARPAVGLCGGGPSLHARIRKLRAFAVRPLPLPLQRVAEAAWADEEHVTTSPRAVSAEIPDADRIFAGVQGYQAPDGGFFLWLPVEDGERRR